MGRIRTSQRNFIRGYKVSFRFFPKGGGRNGGKQEADQEPGGGKTEQEKSANRQNNLWSPGLLGFPVQSKDLPTYTVSSSRYSNLKKPNTFLSLSKIFQIQKITAENQHYSQAHTRTRNILSIPKLTPAAAVVPQLCLELLYLLHDKQIHKPTTPRLLPDPTLC